MEFKLNAGRSHQWESNRRSRNHAKLGRTRGLRSQTAVSEGTPIDGAPAVLLSSAAVAAIRVERLCQTLRHGHEH